MDKLQHGHDALAIPVNWRKCHYCGMPDRSVVAIQNAPRDRSHRRHFEADILLLLAIPDRKYHTSAKHSALPEFHRCKASADSRGDQFVIPCSNIPERKL